MADRTIEFGYFLDPGTEPATALRLGRLVDDLGLDLIGVQDHPYQRRHLDTFSLIAWLAGQTQRVRFFPDVANLPLRGAAMIGKASASLDQLSGGRFELGLGAGGFWDAIAAMGGPRRTPGEAVAATEEAIAVIRALWSGERGLRVDGTHYGLNGVHSGPTPAHDLGIWPGASGPRMLDLIGRRADGWVPSSPWAPPEKLDEFHARIDEAAIAAGRDPAAIRRVYNVSGTIRGDGHSEGFLDGPPDQWIDELTSLAVDHRMDAFVLWPGGDVDTHAEQLRGLAEHLAPAVRAAVRAAAHGGR